MKSILTFATEAFFARSFLSLNHSKKNCNEYRTVKILFIICVNLRNLRLNFTQLNFNP
jgi:hypothetical protein